MQVCYYCESTRENVPPLEFCCTLSSLRVAEIITAEIHAYFAAKTLREAQPHRIAWKNADSALTVIKTTARKGN